jgi:flagellar protein FliL
MTNIDSAAGLSVPAGRGGGSMRMILIIVAAVLVVLVGGGATWFFLLGGKAQLGGHAKAPEAPLPYFLAIKPFVISVGSNAGSPRFVQMGPTLQLPGSAGGDMVNALLPQVQDVIRQTVLVFRSEDLQKPEGINKLRTTLVTKINEMLVQVLGPERIERANGGKADAPVVQAIYFPTLVVE